MRTANLIDRANIFLYFFVCFYAAIHISERERERERELHRRFRGNRTVKVAFATKYIYLPDTRSERSLYFSFRTKRLRAY